MVCRTLRMALLVGAVTAAVVSPAVAQHRAPCCNEPCGAPAACAPAQCAPAPAPVAPAAPQYRTITVTECVPLPADDVLIALPPAVAETSNPLAVSPAEMT